MRRAQQVLWNKISSSIEQMGRSIEGVAGNAESLKASADEASAAIQDSCVHPAGGR